MTGEAFRLSLSPVQEGVEGGSVNTSIARRGECVCVSVCVCARVRVLCVCVCAVGA